MSNVYTTENLIKILADERRACMNGHRLNLTVSPSGSPFLDRFLRSEGIQKFTAYSHFREAVQQYQREHQVSGIVWQTLIVGDRQIRFPKVDDQLAALSQDLELLKTIKPELFTFWHQVTVGLDLYLSLNAGKSHQQITATDVERIMKRTEWASLSRQGQGQMLEIILQLGWGKPEEATYRRGFPDSGSEFIHAVYPGKKPLI
jgi:hypothetical protein